VLPQQSVSVTDLTPQIRTALTDSKMQHGTVTVISLHTTTAITINEWENRLARDMAKFFLDLAPPDDRSVAAAKTAPTATAEDDDGGNHPRRRLTDNAVRYEHNDIDQRPESDDEAQRCRDNGWDIDDGRVLRAWREQEPINAHSHLIAMVLGASEAIPVLNGRLVLGQWQSVLLVDLDGPRDRTVGVHLMGYRSE
jgi:thiamine phosphate synthase YjbQ (UPF0047 family)